MRRHLVWIGSLVGLAASLAGLALLWIGPSLAADARTENVAGPGVDVFVLDRWPAPGDPVRIEVEARGGSAIGVREVSVRLDGEDIGHATGEGVTWGYTITEGRGRASETVLVVARLPEGLAPDEPVVLVIETRYAVALADGVSSFSNVERDDRVELELVPRVGASAIAARSLTAAGALVALAIWMAVALGLATVLRRLDRPRASRAEGEALAIPALMIWLGATLIGYWVFARPLASVLGAMPYVDWALGAAWAIGPPGLAWRLTRDVLPRARWDLRVAASLEKEGYRANEAVAAAATREDVAVALERSGRAVRRRGDRLDARAGSSRAMVRAPERIESLEDLAIESTDAIAPTAIAIALTGAFGAIAVAGESGVDVVRPGDTLEAVTQRRNDRLLREARAILEALTKAKLR